MSKTQNLLDGGVAASILRMLVEILLISAVIFFSFVFTFNHNETSTSP